MPEDYEGDYFCGIEVNRLSEEELNQKLNQMNQQVKNNENLRKD